MAHTRFADGAPLHAGAGEHFGVDKKAVRFRQQVGQSVAAKHLQGAVHVADAGAQQRSRQQVVASRQKATQPGVLPVLAPAHGHASAGGQGEEPRQVGEEELTIGIGEGDGVIARRLEPGAQGRAIAAVDGVSQQTHGRPLGPQSLDQGRRPIATAVIDDQDLVAHNGCFGVVGQGAQGVVGLGDCLNDAGLLVEGGQHEGQAIGGGRTGGSAVHDEPSVGRWARPQNFPQRCAPVKATQRASRVALAPRVRSLRGAKRV